MVLAAYGYVAERGSGSPSTSRPWRVTSSEWSGHGWTGCWPHRLSWPPLPPLHEATGAVASPLMPTRTGYGTPQRPHRPQHKPQTGTTKSLTPNRPHAADPTRKALVTRESCLSIAFEGPHRRRSGGSRCRQQHIEAPGAARAHGYRRPRIGLGRPFPRIAPGHTPPQHLLPLRGTWSVD